jgi:hypothetical protein
MTISETAELTVWPQVTRTQARNLTIWRQSKKHKWHQKAPHSMTQQKYLGDFAETPETKINEIKL